TETERDSDERIAQAAIAVDGVRKRYGRIEALRGVTLEVGRGEIFGLLGANGAGKSTLIKILVGSSRPSAGAVEVLGLDPTRLAIMRDGVVLVCDTPRNILRRGRTVVSVWHDGQVERETLTNYPEQLPRLLRRYYLDPEVDKIEIEEDTLETIVLDLIDAQAS